MWIQFSTWIPLCVTTTRFAVFNAIGFRYSHSIFNRKKWLKKICEWRHRNIPLWPPLVHPGDDEGCHQTKIIGLSRMRGSHKFANSPHSFGQSVNGHDNLILIADAGESLRVSKREERLSVSSGNLKRVVYLQRCWAKLICININLWP